tara:strand:- start:13596 stop:13964 length:369 start_codon:yes stop_codon:yes gene_type:complete
MAAIAPLVGIGAAAGGTAAGGISLGTIISTVGSVIGAVSSLSSKSSPVLTPTTVTNVDTGDAPAAPEILSASQITNESEVEAEKRKRALLLDTKGQVNTLTTRFTSPTDQQAQVNTPTLLGE